jgi:hypothetical protein
VCPRGFTLSAWQEKIHSTATPFESAPSSCSQTESRSLPITVVAVVAAAVLETLREELLP